MAAFFTYSLESLSKVINSGTAIADFLPKEVKAPAAAHLICQSSFPKASIKAGTVALACPPILSNALIISIFTSWESSFLKLYISSGITKFALEESLPNS